MDNGFEKVFFWSIGIFMIFAIIVTPFFMYQDYQMRQAKIEYLNRSKHDVKLDLSNQVRP